MNESKINYTRGPWKVRAATFCEDEIPSYEVVMPGSPTMNAVDARLIGAAPDLYEALKAIAPRCDLVIDRDTGAKCGEVAVSEGSFSFKFCDAHREDRELIDIGVQIRDALERVEKWKAQN